MLNIPAFLAEKNSLEGKGYVMLLELEYAPGLFWRVFRANGHTSNIIFDGDTYTPFPIGKLTTSSTVRGEIPAFDIPIANAGREIQSILEQYIVELSPGRAIWVHPDHLGDATAKVEEKFKVMTATCRKRDAVLTVSAVSFDPLSVKLPRLTVTSDRYPGVPGQRRRYL